MLKASADLRFHLARHCGIETEMREVRDNYLDFVGGAVGLPKSA